MSGGRAPLPDMPFSIRQGDFYLPLCAGGNVNGNFSCYLSLKSKICGKTVTRVQHCIPRDATGRKFENFNLLLECDVSHSGRGLCVEFLECINDLWG